MKDKFISWIAKYPEFQKPQRKSMIEDALKCYDCGVARGALLFSYDALLDAIIEKILTYNSIPSVYSSKSGLWEQIKKNLRNEESFEKQINELLCKSPIDSIFSLGSRVHLLEDMTYWKRRRNDCAHCKNSTITVSNVCAFWSFMMDNYIYFSLEGTLKRCINDYIDLYDISLTKPGSPDDEIFSILCDAIRTVEDIEEFTEEINNSSNIPHNKSFEILHRLLECEKTTNICLSYFHKQDLDDLVNYLLYYPDDVSKVIYKKEDIRMLWYTHTIEGTKYVELFLNLLESDIIEEDEKREAIERQIEQWFKNSNFILINNQYVPLLKRNGITDIFYEKVFKELFERSNQYYMCCKTDYIWPFIENFGLNENMSNDIIDTYSNDGAFPYTIRDKILENFEMVTSSNTNETKGKLKESIIKDMGIHRY